MDLFIKTSITLSFIGVLLRFVSLVACDYPQQVTYSRAEHGFMVVVGVLWCLWGWSVLP